MPRANADAQGQILCLPWFTCSWRLFARPSYALLSRLWLEWDGHWINVTSPEVPFTRMRWPVLMRLVADPVPVTAGKPYSRQTIAACDIMPPISVTVARILPNTGSQLGEAGDLRIGDFHALPLQCHETAWQVVLQLAAPS